jgi:hypothetical protein
MTSKREPGSSGGRRPPADLTKAVAASPLSRPIKVDDVPEGGVEIAIEADAAERAAIAKSAGLIAVDSLDARLEVNKLSETKFRVAGTLRARVAQTCVVSLESFESEIRADVEADFAREDKKGLPRRVGTARRAEPEPVPSFAAELDAPDPIVDGRIDLGALVVEFLMLNLDPYPRKPGVLFDGANFSGSPDLARSPFAALKNLKKEDWSGADD